MPYLNLDLDYFTHPKTMRLVATLGAGSELLPIKLWCHAGKHHAADGVLAGYTPKEIEGIVGWKGKENAFVAGMIRVGYMAETPKGFALHEWLDHEGHLVMFKERAQRAAFKRWGYATSNAKDEVEQSHKQCPNHTIPNQPDHTIPNLTKEPLIPDDLLENKAEILEWLAYKKEKGQTYKPKGLNALWKRFREIPKDQRREAVDHSMANGWAGLFEKKGNQYGQQRADANGRRKIGEPERADSKFAGVVKTMRVGGTEEK